MRMVQPYLNQNYTIKSGKPVVKEELISELGIFGYYIASGESLVANETTGYLLRSKSFGVNEGGVASGYAVLDSIYFV